MKLPVATLDHVVINARNDMDHAADVYTRLGFSLTETRLSFAGLDESPRHVRHRLFELIAIPKDATSGAWICSPFPSD